MLESLREIGKFSLEDKNIPLTDVYSILVENPGSSSNYKHVVSLKFDVQDDIKYKKLEILPIDSNNYRKYLYKRRGSSGANYTPCALVAGKGIDGTFKSRIISWANNYKNDDGLIGKIASKLLELEDAILKDLIYKDKLEDLSNTVLTIKINDKYPGEIEEFKDHFLKVYYETKSSISYDRGTCSLCGSSGFVMGNEKPWTFYSLDKPGFIASGFESKYGWKNFPICKDCSLLIEEGKQYTERFLSYRFSGVSYFLLPKSILDNKEVLRETLYFFEKTHKKLLTTEGLARLADDEDYILALASEQNDIINYNFLFYESAKAKFTILLYLQDILPSMIKRLFDAKDSVEKYDIFKEAIKEKGELKNVIFTFSNLKTFFPNKKTFLNIVEKVFKNRKINYQFLLRQFIAYLRVSFINNKYSTKPTTLKAFQILLLLDNLKILSNYNNKGGQESMDVSIINNDVKKRVEIFFKQFQNTFNSYEKKAIFLTGVLTNYLLNIQKRESDLPPFRKKLKGLKLKQKDILQIFPEVQNKLEEYDENYYNQLEQVIAELFVKAGSKWNITDDEISFYFLLGMDLSDTKDKDGIQIFKA